MMTTDRGAGQEGAERNVCGISLGKQQQIPYGGIDRFKFRGYDLSPCGHPYCVVAQRYESFP